MTQYDDALHAARRNFARQMLALAGASGDRRLEDAFAAVPRERFLGDGAWSIMTTAVAYQRLVERDPILIYQDVVVGLDQARGVNNGSPSLHARFLHAVSPQPGERVAHIGAGAGYYSAILAQLVGEGSHVTAVEFDPGLAQRAMCNLADVPTVSVVCGDGEVWPSEGVDCIYVNFAVVRPAKAWLERLRPGGRLIFPLAPRDGADAKHASRGIALMVTRSGDAFSARAVLGQVAFVCAEGALAGSQTECDALRASLMRGDAARIRGLVVQPPRADADRCWYAADDWALTYDDGVT